MENIDRTVRRDGGLVAYGHSFVKGTGLPDAAMYYANRLATFYEMGLSNRAVGGSLGEQAADVMLTGNPWAPSLRLGGKQTLLIQALINTARKNGEDLATRRGAEHALRTMVAFGSALEIIPEDAPFFTYSVDWTSVSNLDYHGDAYRVTTNDTHWVEFTVPRDGCHFLSAARKESLSGTVISFKRLDTGQTFKTWTNLDQAAANHTRSYVPAAIPLRVPAGTRVRVTLESGINMICDGLIVPADRPAPILMMKEPHLLDYSQSTAFPYGSDAALDYFSSILDTLAQEFPNVIVADPNTSGYWNKNTHILPDGVHPNEYGHQALFSTMVDAVRTTLTQKAWESGLYL